MQKKYVKGLPIYQAGNSLVNLVIKNTKGFTREMRPLIGRMMLEESMRIMGHIIRANTAWSLEEKIERIDRILSSRVCRAALKAGYSCDMKFTKVMEYAGA